MTPSLRLPFGLCLCTMMAVGCSGVNLDDDPATAEGATSQAEADIPVPSLSGQGTADAPYSVEQLTQVQSGDEAWVIGYIVGSAYQSMSNISFTVPTTYKTNLILASRQDVEEDDNDILLPVELKSSLQAVVSLQACPDNLHRCIMLKGTPGPYYSTAGLRAADAYKLLPPDFDLSSLASGAEQWDVEDITR